MTTEIGVTIFFASMWLVFTLVFLKPKVRPVLRSVGLGLATTVASLAVTMLLVAANAYLRAHVSDVAGSAPQSVAAVPKQQSSAQTEQDASQKMSMVITPRQLQQRFNALAQSRELAYRISHIQLAPSTNVADKWLYQFTNRIGILVMVNRPGGDIRSVTYLASGDGTIQSGAHMMFVLTLIVHALDPAMANDTALKLVGDLLDAKPSAGVERVFNGMRYGSIVVPGVGLVIAINPTVLDTDRPTSS